MDVGAAHRGEHVVQEGRVEEALVVPQIVVVWCGSSGAEGRVVALSETESIKEILNLGYPCCIELGVNNLLW